MMQEERMREYREMQVRQFRKMSKAFYRVKRRFLIIDANGQRIEQITCASNYTFSCKDSEPR